MRPIRQSLATWALAALAALALAGGAARAAATSVTCTNQASGAKWQISIDYEKSTVDANPAKISATEITWHEAADGGNYTLDRKTGELTMIVASSTGGFFLHHQCRLGN